MHSVDSQIFKFPIQLFYSFPPIIHVGKDTGLDKDMVSQLHFWWGNSETCINWESFIGCETDRLVYVTNGAVDSDVTEANGELEACSRAKISLAIITISCDKSEIQTDPCYRDFTKILRLSLIHI